MRCWSVAHGSRGCRVGVGVGGGVGGVTRVGWEDSKVDAAKVNLLPTQEAGESIAAEQRARGPDWLREKRRGERSFRKSWPWMSTPAWIAWMEHACLGCPWPPLVALGGGRPPLLLSAYNGLQVPILVFTLPHQSCQRMRGCGELRKNQHPTVCWSHKAAEAPLPGRCQNCTSCC